MPTELNMRKVTRNAVLISPEKKKMQSQHPLVLILIRTDGDNRSNDKNPKDLHIKSYVVDARAGDVTAKQ